MDVLTRITSICSQFGCGLKIHDNGVIAIIFHCNHHGKTPMLLSADEGKTWCPETIVFKEKGWSGNVALTGHNLRAEIHNMCRFLSIPEICQKMVTVAEYVSSEKTLGKKSS